MLHRQGRQLGAWRELMSADAVPLSSRFTLDEFLRGGAYADVIVRLQAHPEESCPDRTELDDERDEDGDELGFSLMPLELALQLGAPADVVTAIVNLLPPEQVVDEDPMGALGCPLRQALLFGAPVEVLRVLLSASPRGIADYYQEDGCSDFLLHAAAEHCSLDAVTLLLNACPGLAKEADDNGNFALHVSLGARMQPWEEPWTRERFDHAKLPAILALLDAYPQAAGIPNGRKYLPLHYAARYGAPEELVRPLLAAYPEAAATSCSRGYLPAHYALGTAPDWHYSRYPPCSLGVQAALLRAHPLSSWGLRHLLYGGSRAEEETLRRLRDEDNTAADFLHIATAHDAPESVLSALMRLPCAVSDGGWLQTFDANGCLPLHYAMSPPAVHLLSNAYPAGLNAGVRQRTERQVVGQRRKRAEAGDAFWPLHRAISFGAPPEVVGALEELTPMDAFGNRPDAMPRMRKSSESDARKLAALRKPLSEARGTAHN